MPLDVDKTQWIISVWDDLNKICFYLTRKFASPIRREDAIDYMKDYALKKAKYYNGMTKPTTYLYNLARFGLKAYCQKNGSTDEWNDILDSTLSTERKYTMDDLLDDLPPELKIIVQDRMSKTIKANRYWSKTMKGKEFKRRILEWIDGIY